MMHFSCRQKLRQVEVALIEYRDSLEDRGVKDVGEIEKKVAFHRKHLESELVVHSNKITLINSKWYYDILLEDTVCKWNPILVYVCSNRIFKSDTNCKLFLVLICLMLFLDRLHCITDLEECLKALYCLGKVRFTRNTAFI